MQDLNEERRTMFARSSLDRREWNRHYIQIIRDHTEALEAIDSMMNIFTLFLFMEYFIEVYYFAHLLYKLQRGVCNSDTKHSVGIFLI